MNQRFSFEPNSSLDKDESIEELNLPETVFFKLEPFDYGEESEKSFGDRLEVDESSESSELSETVQRKRKKANKPG